MRAFTAKFSDLSGPTNPGGLWSPHFIALKQALDRNDAPDNVLQALYDWLNRQGVALWKVDKILDLPDMDQAYEALVALIGAKLRAKDPEGNPALPASVAKTLRAAIQRLAQNYTERGEQNLNKERERLNTIRAKFADGVPAVAVVNRLLS